MADGMVRNQKEFARNCEDRKVGKLLIRIILCLLLIVIQN